VSASSNGSGQGSEFVIRLPLLANKTPSLPVKDTGARKRIQPSATKRQILVVDDNRDSADSLAMLLRLTGHDVRTVHDGTQALDMVKTYRPDFVLLDIGLPVMDGYTIARQIRSDPEVAGTVLVAVTGYGTEEDRRNSHAAGFNYHMVKPVEFSLLQDLLDSSESTANRPFHSCK
jgi:CheY-like chemotaxis protein